MTKERLIYCIRPNGTALYLPALMSEHLGIKYGDRLSQDQYDNDEIRSMLARRIAAEKKVKPSKAFTLLEMLMVVAIVSILALCVFGGWQAYLSSSVRSGVVVDKQYYSAYVTMDGDGNATTHPERWTVTIRGVNKDGELRNRTISVDSIGYHRVKHGEEVSADDL